MLKHCVLIRNMMENMDEQKDNLLLPFYNISEPTMKRVKDFLVNFNQFVEIIKPVTSENLNTVFDNDPYQKVFFKNLSDADLHELVDAANFMDIPALFESCCVAIAVIFKKSQIAYSKELGLKSEVLEKPLNSQEEDLELQKEFAYIFKNL